MKYYQRTACKTIKSKTKCMFAIKSNVTNIIMPIFGVEPCEYKAILCLILFLLLLSKILNQLFRLWSMVLMMIYNNENLFIGELHACSLQVCFTVLPNNLFVSSISINRIVFTSYFIVTYFMCTIRKTDEINI